jgi:hypothetical protein
VNMRFTSPRRPGYRPATCAVLTERRLVHDTSVLGRRKPW